jgi:hypothetical protein
MNVPAFPGPRAPEANCYEGMSLRDWFAGKAMAALIIADDCITYQDAARHAYEHADAMMAVRDKT